MCVGEWPVFCVASCNNSLHICSMNSWQGSLSPPGFLTFWRTWRTMDVTQPQDLVLCHDILSPHCSFNCFFFWEHCLSPLSWRWFVGCRHNQPAPLQWPFFEQGSGRGEEHWVSCMLGKSLPPSYPQSQVLILYKTAAVFVTILLGSFDGLRWMDGLIC